MPDDPVLEARAELLADCWRWWSATLRNLDATQWSMPTGLEQWDVRALVTHHGMFVDGLAFLASHPSDQPVAVASAADMLRGFNAPDGVAHGLADAIADLARAQAAERTNEELIDRFAVDAPAAVAAARESGAVVVDYFGYGAFPIVEALSIGILEAVVHGLDLARAIGSDPDLPRDAVDHVVALLARMPEPIAFIEAAAGRTGSTVLPILR